MKYAAITTKGFGTGLSLIEIMIAIGILAVSMMLIAAAFPAGVAMSIAVSDETTSQAVFQEAVGVIRDNYSVAAPPTGPLSNTAYNVIFNDDLGPTPLDKRQFGTNGVFSWSALIRRMDSSAGPMGNLCQVIVVVSRKPSGSPNFLDNGDNDSVIPELWSVECTGTVGERALSIADVDEFERVPSAGYIIDRVTGTTYSIISRNEGTPGTVTLLTALPAAITSPGRDFWVIPGPYSGPAGPTRTYGRSSPAVRVFQTMLYLP